MELNTVIGLRFKFVRIKVLDYTFLPTCTNWLFSSFTSRENFYMDHVMLLTSTCLIEVSCTVENQITGLKLFKCKIDRQRVILVSLIPMIECKTKIISQVVHYLSYQGTAVEKEWWVVDWIIRTVKLFGIWDTKVLYTTVNKLLTKLTFELWITPSFFFRLLVYCKVSVLYLFFSCFAEALEIFLETSRRLHTWTKAQKLAFWIIVIVVFRRQYVLFVFFYHFS